MPALLRCDIEHRLLNILDVSSIEMLPEDPASTKLHPAFKVKMTVGDEYKVSPTCLDYNTWIRSMLYGVKQLGGTYFIEYPAAIIEGKSA